MASIAGPSDIGENREQSMDNQWAAVAGQASPANHLEPGEQFE